MGLLRNNQEKDVRLYRDAHRDICVDKIDFSKTYHVCNATLEHLSTDSWDEADTKYSEWSGEEKLELMKRP